MFCFLLSIVAGALAARYWRLHWTLLLTALLFAGAVGIAWQVHGSPRHRATCCGTRSHGPSRAQVAATARSPTDTVFCSAAEPRLDRPW